ncbi:MAG: hypothetical protein GXP31_06395 [Kiritimatiellaeota bacterium]|nr:hypothetical protein [Kiritimatiellota bacterium]
MRLLGAILESAGRTWFARRDLLLGVRAESSVRIGHVPVAANSRSVASAGIVPPCCRLRRLPSANLLLLPFDG